ncbi:MAG TPA: type II toxin-antitoxin system HicB family antitoxin [Gemmatimonadaceae bacterium]|nr:type II toxin-antitoxin system HicB family antitoxin [Gemmatimonadaceae bacterium]
MSRYAILIEPTETGFSAYSPDLPGCISTGRTAAEAASNMRDAVESHLEELRLAGEPIPQPTIEVGYVEVAA